jgi:hypothetical protein
MSKSTRFVGLDDSKDSIEVAVAESGRDVEVHRFGLIPNTPAALRKLVRQLGRPKALHFVYEAGPSGYGIHRELVSLGANCIVAAPTKTPHFYFKEVHGRDDTPVRLQERGPGCSSSRMTTGNLRRNVLKVLTSPQISDVSVSAHYGHTPRNALMVMDEARYFQGGPHPGGEGDVPALTGLVERGRYTDAAYLTLARLPESEVRAIAEYLVSLP